MLEKWTGFYRAFKNQKILFKYMFMSYKYWKDQSIKIIGNRANDLKARRQISWRNLFELLNDKIERIEISYLHESDEIDDMKETGISFNQEFIDKIKENENSKVKIKRENVEDEILRLIEEANIKLKPLDLVFNKGELEYDSIKEAVFNKVNNYPNISELYVKISFTYEDITKHRIYSLSNEYARNLIFKILKEEEYKFEEEAFTNEFIQDSSTNEILRFASIRDIKMIRFCTTEQLNSEFKNSTNIFSDNGRSFYKYKIDDQLLDNI